MKIRIAVASTNTPADLDHLAALVDGLEERRFDTLWLSDTPMTPAVEPLLALAIASSRTTRLKLGTNVVVPGRNPLHLAKELAHLDRLHCGVIVGRQTDEAYLALLLGVLQALESIAVDQIVI